MGISEVITATPYAGQIAYDKDTTKSLLNKAEFKGIHLSVGTLNYLLEMEYAKMNISYKNKAYQDFSEDDISLAYSLYFKYFMFKIGGHYLKNNDPVLSNGYTAFATIGGYVSNDKESYSYGIENYYSHYKNAHNEAYVPQAITIVQLTPYFKFQKQVTEHWNNMLEFKMNYQITNDYLQKKYLSYEFKNTLRYDAIALTLKTSQGEMKTGVKDGGFTIINTLDVVKSSYGAKVGYSFLPNATVALNYNVNNYQEYGFTEDAQSSLSMLSLEYRF